jgi:type II pantothenate kinase
MDNNQVMKNSDIVIRDDVLSIYSKVLGGRLHFLHFETRNMVQTIKFLSSNALAENITSIGCTGGGSHKYADEFQQELEITFNKFDELGCLVRGMHFALTNFKDECYTFRNAVIPPVEVSPGGTSQPVDPVPISVKRWQKDLKEYTQRVDLPYEALSSFPYLVVNIGSGVSILKVSAPGVYERVSGSSLGGGTYWGLCRLLTKCATYDEVLDVAETGDAGQVDMLVKDIYGGDCESSCLFAVPPVIDLFL